MAHDKFLVVLAMKEEGQNLFEQEGAQTLYTGLGKINATFYLAQKLLELKHLGRDPKVVFNFGTAGSSIFKTHAMVECHRFVQRDMDVSALGFKAGTTPFEEAPPMIEYPRRAHWLEGGLCGTGDSFETGKPKVECQIVDMEAYALAKVCLWQQIPFVSIKYITDGSDHNAHNDWHQNLPKAADGFIKNYRRLINLDFTENR